MGSHSVTCHTTEVRIPPLLTAEAGTRFSDPGGMQGSVDVRFSLNLRRGVQKILGCHTDDVDVSTYSRPKHGLESALTAWSDGTGYE